jgi:hypothetical protein
MKLLICSKSIKKMIRQILADQQTIISNQQQLKELFMAVKDDLAAFAAQVDAVTNTIGANVSVVAQKISDLQAQISAGTLSPAELSAALNPVKAHLQTVSDSLAAVASGGTVVIPPVEPL